VAYYGKYGHGLRTFAEEWNLNLMKPEEIDPIVFDALQSFLDIISPERGYRLSFVERGTAATSFSSKRVTVTSEALRGRYLVDQSRWETGATEGKATKSALKLRSNGAKRFYITAGMLCHEVSHIRYGQDTAGAVDKAYAKSKNLGLARQISNILDENRIEAAFAYDFPGFADVFPHVLEWVARKSGEGRAAINVEHVTNRAEALNAALMGSRFYKWVHSWDATTKSCIDWGRKWDKKYTGNDTVELHLAGVAAMIEWLKQFPPPPKSAPPPPPPPPPPSDEDEDEDEELGPGGCDFGMDDDESDEDESEDGSCDGGEDDEDDESDERDPDDDQDDWDESGNPRDEEEDDESEGDEDEDEESESGGSKDGGIDAVEPVEEDPDEEPVLTEEEATEATKSIPDVDGATESKSDRGDQKIERDMDKAMGEIEIIKGRESDAAVRLTRNPRPRKGVYGLPDGDVAIATEVRLAFESTRYAHDEWASGYQTGRFRSRDSARAASGDLNVFSRRVSESSTRVHLALLVDYSGSMSGGPFEQACSLAQTLVMAMEGSQVYRQSVWQYLSGDWRGGRHNVNLNRLWISGDAKAIKQALIDGGPADSGTPTGPACYALGHEVLADRRGDEAMVILSITDGDPDDKSSVVYAREYWAERGVAFVGVNIDSSTNPNNWYFRGHPERLEELPGMLLEIKHKMEAQYGEGNTIQFDGNWKHLAEDIGMVVGKALAGTIGK